MAITLPRDRMGATIDALRPGTAQNLEFSDTSAATDAFTSQAVLRVVASENCWIVVGAAPTATAGTGMRLIADWPERIVVAKGEKIAALRDGAASGSLNIVELG
jgi:hypothetical protein